MDPKPTMEGVKVEGNMITGKGNGLLKSRQPVKSEDVPNEKNNTNKDLSEYVLFKQSQFVADLVLRLLLLTDLLFIYFFSV